jgi:regulator of cell morphogenesis and NO signaling
MSEQTATFNEVVENNFSTLDLYTTAITRAHGKNHPEAFKVRELFEVMNEKVEKAGTGKPNLDEEFTKLRNITNNYTIPENVCETYAGVYNMLSEADKSYHS